MDAQRILMGVVGRPHGVRGLVRVHSYAAVPADLASYGALSDDRGQSWTLSWRGEGIAALTDASGRTIADRDEAAKLVNRKLFVTRDRLPEPDEDEFYLADLVGMRAVERTEAGERSLGKVLAVHDYGAGPSLELEGGALVPFTRACVPDISVAENRLVVAMPDEMEVRDERNGDDPS
ncbi:ribosome maturation factor RimM [Acetobacteraceae bacterium KSS8]|uniref:Ribosome maturation factor RimM n=1 Tax=Endosaccharibacter trunci TaxID=2812733 RepID=A0ABT1W937_9PROT|nr:ribosome maturation factor RimM [Acetobacteraceae bacterium KSS8]